MSLTYNARSIQSRLNRFKKEAWSFSVIFLDQASISKYRGKVIRENIPVKRNQIPVLASFKKPSRMVHCKIIKNQQIKKRITFRTLYTSKLKLRWGERWDIPVEDVEEEWAEAETEGCNVRRRSGKREEGGRGLRKARDLGGLERVVVGRRCGRRRRGLRTRASIIWRSLHFVSNSISFHKSPPYFSFHI